jgi:hypothetical protein
VTGLVAKMWVTVYKGGCYSARPYDVTVAPIPRSMDPITASLKTTATGSSNHDAVAKATEVATNAVMATARHGLGSRYVNSVKTKSPMMATPTGSASTRQTL